MRRASAWPGAGRACMLPALVSAQACGILLADWLDPGIGALLLVSLHLGVAAFLGRGWLDLRVSLALVLALAAGAAGSAGRKPETEGPASTRETTIEGRVASVRQLRGSFVVELDEIAPQAAGLQRLLVRGPWPREASAPSGRLEPGASDAPRAAKLPRAVHPSLAEYSVGSRVRARVRLRPPTSRCNPGRPDPLDRLARRGISAVGSLVHPALHLRLRAPSGPAAWLAGVRARARAELRMHGRGGALIAALSVGDRDGLLAGDRDALSRLGLSHLLAVSGLHLALVAGGVYALVRQALGWSAFGTALDARRLALLPALLAALAYGALAGMGAPVRRALVFLAVLALTACLRRPLPRGRALWLAGGVLLALDPSSLFSPGAQLSFAATAAIVLGARASGAVSPTPGWAGRARVLLEASASAVLATAPLVAFYFGVSSPVGWLANLLAIPLTAAVLLPAALLAGTLAGLGLPIGLGYFAAGGACLLDIARAAGSFVPFASGLAPPGWAFAGAVGLGLIGLRRPGLLLRVVAAVLASGLLALAPRAPVWPMPPRVVALDVGQGDAILVQGRHAAVLVDGARAVPGRFDAGAQIVVPALRALGVRRLDLVVATHADTDHRGGLPAVLAAIPVGRVWLPPGGRGDPSFSTLLAAARDRGTRVEERGAVARAEQLGDLSVETLWPPRGWSSAGDNAGSLVLRITSREGGRVLLPGDIERASEAELIRRGTDLRADVLLLPHHGSRTSSSPAFLEAVDPTLAIASSPLHSRFGMPHEEVRQRVGAIGARLLWTGRDGAVRVSLGPGLDVETGGCR